MYHCLINKDTRELSEIISKSELSREQLIRGTQWFIATIYLNDSQCWNCDMKIDEEQKHCSKCGCQQNPENHVVILDSYCKGCEEGINKNWICCPHCGLIK